MKKRKSSINTVYHDAPTESARFIYVSTTTHDGSATIHHGVARNAHDASTIRYGASTMQAGSVTVASLPSTNLHDSVVVMRQSKGGGGDSLFFFFIRRLRPSIYSSPQTYIRNFKHPQKIEILQIKKYSPFCTLTLNRP